MIPIDVESDNYVAELLDECVHETMDPEDGYGLYSHEKCEKYIYGASGFGTQFFDTICSCPNHEDLKHHVRAYKNRCVVQEVIEQSMQEAAQKEK